MPVIELKDLPIGSSYASVVSLTIMKDVLLV